MLRSSIAVILVLLTIAGSAQSASERGVVRLTATVQSTAPSITLTWAPISSTTSISIQRKTKESTSWGAVMATPAVSALQWTDNSVSIGINYEYRVVRISNGITGTGYISTGIQVPVSDFRGKMILLVDNTLALQLVAEIDQLVNDLRGDGWTVLRSDVSRTASVPSVKAIVQGHYNSDPTNVKALFLLGHVPVPYSGNITPDGHDVDRGARPADGYYGDVNGTWTDNTVNTTISAHIQAHNVPGDGKFDQGDFPSPLELQVGRVDLYDLPAFASSELELMRNYLNKAHSYKIKGWEPTVRALLVDNLQWLGNPISGSTWRTAPLAGPVSPVPPAPVIGFNSYVNGQSYLWTGNYGGGSQLLEGGVVTYNGIDGSSITQDLAGSVVMGGAFNMQMGSYFYDFDNRNNYLRAVIARGDGLTNVWAGIPSWYFHHMGMGDNIGYDVLQSMNNTGMYTPLTEGWQTSIGRTHMSLMGDPSLRMKMVTPPTNLTVSNSGGFASFAWTASSESVIGYHLYQFEANTGLITRLTSAPVTGTSYTNPAIPFAAGREYMVRAVKLETNFSGSFYNQSLGALAIATGTSPTAVLVKAKVMLEGPYGTGPLMSDALRAGGYIPTAEPYVALGFPQTGGGNETVGASVLSVTGTNAIVDWVRLELRSGPPGYNLVAARSALVQRDGDVVDLNGTSPVSFSAPNGNYHVVVYHRNHLGIMTASPVALSSTSVTVNFKASSTATYGTNSRKVSGSTYMMWAGDSNSDGMLIYTGQNNDRDPVLNKVGGVIPTNTLNGYWREDLNMNGVVSYTGNGNDRDFILQNIGGIVPTNTRTEQVP